MKLSSSRFIVGNDHIDISFEKNCCSLRGTVFEGSRFCPEEFFKHTQRLISCPEDPRTLSNTQPDDSLRGFCIPLRWGPPPPHYVVPQNSPRSTHKGAATTVLVKLYLGIDKFFESWPTGQCYFKPFCSSANHALPTPPLKYPLGTQRTLYGHRAPKETIVSFLKLRYRGYTAFFDLLKAGQPPSSRLWNLKSLICIILTLFFTSPILSQT